MIKWTYMNYNVSPRESVNDALNKHGESAWEAFALLHDAAGWATIYFKRPA